LRITASAPTDAAEPRESAPATFYWPWYWHVPGLGPWLLLAMAIALPRINRNRQGLLILIPVLIVAVLWTSTTRIGRLPSAFINEFGLVVQSLAVGMALLWLGAGTLIRRGSFAGLFLSWAAIVLAVLVTAVSHSLAFSPDMIPMLALLAMLGAALVAALAAARRLTRGRYAPVRFLLWLVLGSLLFSVAGTIVLVGGMMLAMSGSLHGILIQAVWGGLIFGLCVYVINLPYLLLMFTSPFFRRRFQAWLGVESV